MPLLGDKRGVAAVEFALIMPVFLVLVMGGFNLGWAFLLNQRLEFAAEGAARCAAIGKCSTDSAITDYATKAAAIDGAEFHATAETCGKQVTGHYQLDVIQLFSPIVIDVTACYPTS